MTSFISLCDNTVLGKEFPPMIGKPTKSVLRIILFRPEILGKARRLLYEN
jgi:hypothetical protein